LERLIVEHPANAIGYLKTFAGKPRDFTHKVEDLPLATAAPPSRFRWRSAR
jgi:hypothetical protein